VAAFPPGGPTDDGVIEPGQKLCVGGVSVVNTGGLVLPEGALVHLASDPVDVAPTCLMGCLPEINPGASLQFSPTTPFPLTVPPPPKGTGVLTKTTSLTLTSTLLGRPFPSSGCSQKVIVQWPVRLVDTWAPTMVAAGDTFSMSFAIANISSRHCGSEGAPLPSSGIYPNAELDQVGSERGPLEYSCRRAQSNCPVGRRRRRAVDTCAGQGGPHCSTAGQALCRGRADLQGHDDSV